MPTTDDRHRPRRRRRRLRSLRTLYDGDDLIGCVDPGYGPMVVDALNQAERVGGHGPSCYAGDGCLNLEHGDPVHPGDTTLYCRTCGINRFWDEEDPGDPGVDHWPGSGMASTCPRCGAEGTPATADGIVDQLSRQWEAKTDG